MPKKTRILVLDNDLAIYNTTVYDVAMRKTPTVKEMMNPFNVVKILKDTDVVISKKEESVKTIQKECIDRLDLSYDESDLDEIAKDGTASPGKRICRRGLLNLWIFLPKFWATARRQSPSESITIKLWAR